MKFSLMMLTLNEIDGMRVVLPRIRKEWVDEVYIIDGGSTDGTIEYAREMGFPIIQQRAPGVIAAWEQGVEMAKGDVIITFSPDNNSVPEEIPKLVEKMREGYDMVVVSRYLDAAESEDDSWLTGFGNWMFSRMVSLLFSTNCTDLMVIFRAFRKGLPEELGIKPCRAIHTQLAIRCAKQGKRVAEIPGDEPPRLGGVTKRSIVINGCIELYTIFSEFLRIPECRERFRRRV